MTGVGPFQFVEWALVRLPARSPLQVLTPLLIPYQNQRMFIGKNYGAVKRKVRSCLFPGEKF